VLYLLVINYNKLLPGPAIEVYSARQMTDVEEAFNCGD
jgi:hypothetical protein